MKDEILTIIPAWSGLKGIKTKILNPLMENYLLVDNKRGYKTKVNNVLSLLTHKKFQKFLKNLMQMYIL